MGQYTSRLQRPQVEASTPLSSPATGEEIDITSERFGSQSLRRRRSSTNTISNNQPPPRRRRFDQIRFWNRGNNTIHDIDEEPSSNRNIVSNDYDRDSDAAQHPQQSQDSQQSNNSTLQQQREAILPATLPQQIVESVINDLNNSNSLYRPYELPSMFASQNSSTTNIRRPTASNSEVPPLAAMLSNHTAPTSTDSNSTSGGAITFERQTIMLARLLEAAATTTILSLVGSSVINGRRFDNSSPRSEEDSRTSWGNDSNYLEFIAALRNGLLTNELARVHSDTNNETTFFRAFRFDDEESSSPSSTSNSNSTTTTTTTTTTATNVNNSTNFFSNIMHNNNAEDNDTHFPMVPVMIVGVRSGQPDASTIPSHSGTNDDENDSIWTESLSRSNSSESEINNNYANTNNNPSHIVNNTQELRSWVIFVMGNTFRWNHPLLSAPSLMSENPTYEDLLNLQELIGQVKPPVATPQDLNNQSDKIFEIQLTTTDSSNSRTFEPESNYKVLKQDCMVDRCQICLSDYENHDIVRKLANCNHFYHKECIENWLLNGKNNCPLCRSKGVETSEKEQNS